MLVGAIACAVGVPRQVIAFAGGFAHGVWRGTLLALAAQLLGCLADLLWARLVARDWVRRRLEGRFGAALSRLDAFLAAHPFSATLTLRLLPVGNNLLFNLLAGAFGMSATAFIAASAIGYVPQTLVFVLLGTGVRIGHWIEVALALATFGASLAIGMVLLRRTRAGALNSAPLPRPGAATDRV